MKEKILNLLREMTNDSKAASHKAEKDLCNILNEMINKLHEVEEKVGWSVRDYPDKIDSIEVDFWYSALPEEINCNDYFCFKFKTEWLDINLQEYFEELKKKKINEVERYITQTEHSLSKYKENLKHVEELKFEDLGI